MLKWLYVYKGIYSLLILAWPQAWEGEICV